MIKYNKYSNKKVKADGYVFDSKKEYKRYTELKLLMRAKKISNLELQPKFLLQESFKVDGKTHRAIHYVADFRYIQDGHEVIEDVKGFLTEIFKLKKKLLLYKYKDIDFREL